MNTDEIELKAEVVVAAYKKKVAELQEQVIMLQALLTQLTQSDETEE